MTVYLTKTWGFSAPSGPLQFSARGWRDRARAMLKDGDLVVIVGTMGNETIAGERGKILGLMEPTKNVVNSLDYSFEKRPSDLNKDGDYRWPFGLELRRAWRFLEPRRTLAAISQRKFSMDAAQGIVPLLPDEAEAILRLPIEEIDLLRPLLASVRMEGEDIARRKSAPPPTTTRTGVMHVRRQSAYTYAMALEGSTPSAFKIGWAFDWRLRQRDFNQIAAPTLGGVRYRTVFYQLWPTATEAFRMEQSLLRQFDTIRHAQNPEILSPINKGMLEDAWLSFVRRHQKKNI